MSASACAPPLQHFERMQAISADQPSVPGFVQERISSTEFRIQLWQIGRREIAAGQRGASSPLGAHVFKKWPQFYHCSFR